MSSVADSAVWLPRLPALLEPFFPPPWDVWGPVVRAGLEELLAAVPEKRRREAEVAQAALPETTSPAERIAQLALAFPTLHKLGQVVARDRRLSSELRSRLTMLESLVSTVAGSDLRELLEQVIGRDRLASLEEEVEFEERALSEGSVAIVVGLRVRHPRGGHPELPELPQAGVAKLLKPGIEQRLREELEVWPRVAEAVERRSEDLGLKAPDLGEALGEVQQLLVSETRFADERRSIVEASGVLEKIPGVRVPTLLPWQAPGMTTLERLPGVKATEATEELRRDAAPKLVRSLIAAPMLLATGGALFHGDPHAGNLLLAPRPDETPRPLARSGRCQLGVLDWSLTARIDKEERVELARAVLAGMTLDRRRLRRALGRLAVSVSDESALHDSVDRAVAKVRRLEIPAVRWLVDLIDDVVVHRAARFSSGMLLFRKSLLTVEGVLEDLDPKASVDRLFLRYVLEQAVADSPRRALSPPWSRRYGTHLSNLDLVRLLASGPGTALRFWTQTLRAGLESRLGASPEGRPRAGGRSSARRPGGSADK